MKEREVSIYKRITAKGISRRDFLRYCTMMGGMLGLSTSGISQVVDALMSKPRLPVIWYHFQECTCCSESFTRASHPLIEQMLFDMISLDYTDTLMAASGFQAEAAKEASIKKNYGNYLMVVEGSVPFGSPGYCTIAGKDAYAQFKEGADGAKAIIAWGNCASSGCIQHARPNPTDARPIHEIYKGDKPIINVQGCPPIADVMAGVITYMLTFDKIPELDGLMRPKVFYGRRIHDTCYRRPAFDAGLFVESFDDENAKKGYCLYHMGCKGPDTFNSCAVIKWNNNVSYPIQSGHGCIGCSEPNFWDHTPLYSHLPNIHGFGINATADQIGATVAGITVAGITVHAIATNIRKRKLIENQMDDFSLNKEDTKLELQDLKMQEKRENENKNKD